MADEKDPMACLDMQNYRTVLVGLARLMQCQLQPRFCQIFD